MTKFGVLLVLLSLGMSVLITLLGWYFSKKKLASKDAYFTAGRNITVAFMTATFIAYAVGTGLIFSPAEMAYYDGLTAMIGYGLAISLAYLIFIPFTKRIKELIPEGHTIGEYTKVRYGNFMYFVTLAVTIIYMFILLASNLIGAAIAFRYLGGVPMVLGVLIIGVPIIIYTTYGGLGAAIFTNGIQAILITPLLLIPCAMAFFKLGGPGAVFDGIMKHNPDFLKISYGPGLEFGLMIIIAVAAAEMMNQALWQRIYSAESHAVVVKSLISSAIMTFPMTIVAASLGLIAVSMGIELPHPSIASALVTHQLLPSWVSALFVMVVVLAAASTGGDALSGFSSIFSIDIVKPLYPTISPKGAITAARIGSVIFGILAMVVAYFAPSILFLLLTADLLASAAVIPVLCGLFSTRVSGTAAAIATLAGIACGIPMFIAKLNLQSFATALLVSGIVVFIFSKTSKYEYDFKKLTDEIKQI